MASLHALGLSMVILAGLLLRPTVLWGEESPFMMELPLYRAPSLRNLGMFAGSRPLAFLKKAGTVILGVSVLIWLLSSFPAGADLPQTYPGRLGFRVEQAGRLPGLDWRMSVALGDRIRRQGNFAGHSGRSVSRRRGSLAQALRRGSTRLVALVFVVVQLLHIPCLARVAVMRSETNSWKWTALGVFHPLALAGGLGLLIFEIGKALGFG